MLRLGRLRGTSSLYHAARRLFGSISHKQFAPAWQFFQQAEIAADIFMDATSDSTLDVYSAPLVRGQPELGNGIRQLRAQAFVEFTDPSTGLRRTITAHGDFGDEDTQAALIEGLFEAAGQQIENYVFASLPGFDFDDTQPTLTLQWVVRRF